MNDVTETLPSSKLGTKTYWDDVYEKEIAIYTDNQDEEGENWFGHARMMKVVNYIKKNKDIGHESKILDIGCGNGLFVHEMAEEGYENVYGIDYSHQAIQLAEAIAKSHDVKCKFSQADFLDDSTWNVGEEEFDVCHDKGTYDAVCLDPDNAEKKRLKYISNLNSLLTKGSLFIITSCNWTLDELKKHLHAGFDVICDIPAPSFQFGGQTGQTVTTIVFKKC